jgi:hypothetical protein
MGWIARTCQHPALGQVADQRVSADGRDLPESPGLVEEGLQRTVNAQDDKPALLGVGLDPIAGATPSGWVGEK